MENEQRQYVLFRLRSEEYGVPIEGVRSIIRYESPTPVPRAPASVDGVVNLRGQVIPVVDLGKRLLGQEFEVGATSRIIVAESESGLVGLVVDAAHEVVSIPVESILPAPESALSPETAEAFDGVASLGEAHLVILLDLDHALPKSEYAGVTQEGGIDV